MTKGVSRWVLAIPFVCLTAASWLFIESNKEGQVLFERSKEQWRLGEYGKAVELFLSLCEKNPDSPLADDALWEVATIYYFNLYDISNSLHYFERLINEYPSSPYVAECHMRLAEIYEVELNEVAKAQEHWRKILEAADDPEQKEQVEFRLADSDFKINEFDRAFEVFSRLVSEAADHHLVQQSQVRLGTILQIRRQHDEALEMLAKVAQSTSCQNCRLRAQLGMIECYEYLDRLEEAIAVAENISPRDYPTEMKEDLLNRLLEKKKHYEPSLWNRR